MNENYNFVKRTQQNFKHISKEIEKKKIPINNNKFYEVTNLLCYCLGLISFVNQAAEDETDNILNSTSNNKNRNELIKQILDKILKDITYSETKYGTIIVCYPKWAPTDVSTTDISTIVYRMRNAICHNDIEPIGGEKDINGNQLIEKIRFVSKNDKNNIRFHAEMTIKQIHQLVMDVSNAYLKYYNI